MAPSGHRVARPRWARPVQDRGTEVLTPIQDLGRAVAWDEVSLAKSGLRTLDIAVQAHKGNVRSILAPLVAFVTHHCRGLTDLALAVHIDRYRTPPWLMSDGEPTFSPCDEPCRGVDLQLRTLRLRLSHSGTDAVTLDRLLAALLHHQRGRLDALVLWLDNNDLPLGVWNVLRPWWSRTAAATVYVDDGAGPDTLPAHVHVVVCPTTSVIHDEGTRLEFGRV